MNKVARSAIFAAPEEGGRRAGVPSRAVRSGFRIMLCAVAFACLASAGGVPWVAETASAARAAHARADASVLRALASREVPDPWLVADLLLAEGDREVARAWAAAAARVGTEHLATYVEAHRAPADDVRRRDALRVAQAYLSERDPEGALRQLDPVDLAPDDVVSIRVLGVRTRALLARLAYEEAARASEDAGTRAARLGWWTAASEARERRARCLSRKGDAAASLAATEAWRDAEHRMGSSIGVARADAWRAGLLNRLGRREEALRLATDLRSAQGESGDPEVLAEVDRTLGYLRATASDIPGAVERWTSALAALDRTDARSESSRFLRDPESTARSRVALLVNLAQADHRMGRPAEAQARLRQAEEVGRGAGLPAALGHAVAARGAFLDEAGDRLGAREAYTTAVEAYRAGGERALEAAALRRLATVSLELGDLPGAAAASRAVLTIAEGSQDPREAVRARIAYGRVLLTLGEPREASRVLEEARRAAASLPDPVLQGQAVRQLSVERLSRGDLAGAWEAATTDVGLQRTAAAGGDAAAALIHLARILLRLHDYPRAEATASEALQVASTQQDRRLAAAARLTRGAVRQSRGDHDGTIADLREAAGLLEGRSGARERAWALALAAHSECEAGHGEDALARAAEARAAFEAVGDATGVAQVGIVEIAALLLLRRDEEAVTHADRVVGDAESTGDPWALAQGLWAAAAAFLRVGRPREAVAAARRSLDEAAVLPRRLADGEGAEVRETFAPAAEIGLGAALALEDAAAVYEFLERGRADTLLEALGGREALRATVVPAALRAEEGRARAAQALALARLRAAVSSGDRESVRKGRQEAAAAAEEVRRVVSSIQRSSRLKTDAVFPVVAPLEGLLSALARDTAVVVYGLSEYGAVALVLEAGKARIVHLGSAEAVRGACEAACGETRPYVDPEALAALQVLVVDPLGLSEGTRRIVVSPDGPLAFLPPRLLFEGLDVAYVPSASTYAMLQASPRTRGIGVLALGDPDYTAGGSGSFAGGARIVPLPATRDEAKRVGTDVRLGRDASETALRKALAGGGRRRAIHLACHGLLDPAQPLYSALALAADPENDGLLTALDVGSLRIEADLAVLSGCETGRGTIVRGEGVMGLTRAFMAAGAPRVLVSLWKVDDDATSLLMGEFYARWNPARVEGGPGMDAVTALREAQDVVRARPGWEHPTYWAGWVLWGLPGE